MLKTAIVLLSAASCTFASASTRSTGGNRANASPIYSVVLPPGYRNWRVISVAHEAGSLNDIRIILGNDTALKAFRKGIRPFPNGTILARLAYKYVSSAQNNAVFGQEQSFVAGDATNVQIEVKDSKRFPATAGWGYAQFEGGTVNPSLPLTTACATCHQKLPASADLVFTQYAQ